MLGRGIIQCSSENQSNTIIVPLCSFPQSMWKDNCAWYRASCQRAIKPSVADGDSFSFRGPFLYDTFFHYLRKSVKNHQRCVVKKGEWRVWDFSQQPKKGTALFVKMLGGDGSTPKRVTTTTIVKLERVWELAYGTVRRELRVRAFIKTNAIRAHPPQC